MRIALGVLLGLGMLAALAAASICVEEALTHGNRNPVVRVVGWSFIVVVICLLIGLFVAKGLELVGVCP